MINPKIIIEVTALLAKNNLIHWSLREAEFIDEK